MKELDVMLISSMIAAPTPRSTYCSMRKLLLTQMAVFLMYGVVVALEPKSGSPLSSICSERKETNGRRSRSSRPG